MENYFYCINFSLGKEGLSSAQIIKLSDFPLPVFMLKKYPIVFVDRQNPIFIYAHFAFIRKEVVFPAPLHKTLKSLEADTTMYDMLLNLLDGSHQAKKEFDAWLFERLKKAPFAKINAFMDNEEFEIEQAMGGVLSQFNQSIIK